MFERPVVVLILGLVSFMESSLQLTLFEDFLESLLEELFFMELAQVLALA